MTGGERSDLQGQLDALADDLVRRGLAEGGDFFVSGHLAQVRVSSEYVGLSRLSETLRVFYADMGHERVVLETSDLAAARSAFLREALQLARGRGREVDEEGLAL